MKRIALLMGMAGTSPAMTKVELVGGTKRMWVAGVDGCRAGWIAVLMRVDDPHTHRIVTAPTLEAIADAPEQPAVIAIDMPIGLPERTEGSGRMPEQLIRPLLGERQSSVFAIPSRSAVEAMDYAQACAIAAATSEPSRKVSRRALPFPQDPRDRCPVAGAARSDAARLRGASRARLLGIERRPGAPSAEEGEGHALRARHGVAARALAAIQASARRSDKGAAAPRRGPGRPARCARGVDRGARSRERWGQSFPDRPGRDAHGLPIAIWTLRSKLQRSPMPITHAEIEAAHARIAPHIRRTPVLDLATPSAMTGR